MLSTGFATDRRSRPALLSIVVLLSCAQPLMSRTPLPSPQADVGARPTPLLPDVVPCGFSVLGKVSGRATASVVPATGAPFARALRVVTTAATEHPWDVLIASPTTAGVAAGDVIRASFWVRAQGLASATAAQTQMIFEEAGGKYAKSVERLVRVGPEWRRIQLAFRALADYAPGKAHVGFFVGYRAQTIDLGEIELVDLGRAAAIETLPGNAENYDGRAADATWRREAEARIEAQRKASIRVSVLDRAGHPAPGVTVKIHQTRASFAWGTAVAADLLAGPPRGRDASRYRETCLRVFDRAVLENAMKWPQWEGKDGPIAAQAVDWLRRSGLSVRGHNLVWPSWSRLPPKLTPLTQSPDSLRQRILDHVKAEAGVFRGKLVEWDVINEPISSGELIGLLGPTACEDWLRAAREADAEATLMVNEDGLVNALGEDGVRQDAYATLIRSLIDAKAPLGAVGIQAHFVPPLTPPAMIPPILDRLAALGLPLEITELDIATANDALQADYLRDVLTAFYSHPAVRGVLLWGFWEGRIWRKNAALYRQDFSPRPAGTVLEDLVLRKWRTDVTATTDGAGTATVRGFLGDYTIEAAAAARCAPVRATLAGGGLSVTLRLD